MCGCSIEGLMVVVVLLGVVVRTALVYTLWNMTFSWLIL